MAWSTKRRLGIFWYCANRPRTGAGTLPPSARASSREGAGAAGDALDLEPGVEGDSEGPQSDREDREVDGDRDRTLLREEGL